MYLKRLEMVGFKSFAERTRLDFERGVTAVVGPNGCGKSNVVDAVRWCLGEMSAKSLRSKVLIDVIFNGSANRAPSNLAEVSITFDNSQNRLPIDYSEVTFTRRLFRSGESEYFLNKTQCRLKDIRELLLDTGIGEDGYSIIEQGRVEHILTAKPEERRELFEEAAGVSKYKARREEALRRLERTQLDLDRLADVLVLTKEQMDKIDAAVRKARQYQKIQDNLKSLEISHALFESKQLEEQMTAMMAAQTVMEKDLQQRTSEAAAKEAERTELHWAETQLGEKMVELNRRLSELDGAMNLSEQKQTTARERQAELLHRDLVLDGEITQGQARLAELVRLAQETEASLLAERESARVSAEFLAEVDRVYQGKAALLAEVQNVAKTIQDALWANTQERTRLNNDIVAQRSLETRLETQLGQWDKDLAKVSAELAELRTGLADAQNAAAADTERLAAAESRASAAREAVGVSDKGVVEAQEKISRVQEELFRAQAQLDAQEEWESSDVYARGVSAVLGANFAGIHGPVGKLIDVSTSDEVTIRRALGVHVNDLVADTLEDAQSAVRFLSQGGHGRARFLVLNRLPQGTSSLDAGVGQRRLIDKVRVDSRFVPVARFLLGGWIAADDGLYGDGLVEGGSESSAAPVFDALRRENLQKDIAAQTAALESAVAGRRASEETRRVAQEENDAARRSLEEVRAQMNMRRQDVARLEKHAGLVEKDRGVIENDVTRARAEEAKAKTAAAELETRLESLKNDETRLREDWSKHQTTLQERQNESFAASSELAVAKERAHGHEERLRWKEKQSADILSERTALSGSLDVKIQERAGSAARVEEQKQFEKDAEALITALMVQRTETDRTLEGVHGERRLLAEKTKTVETALTDLRKSNEEMQSQWHDKKLQHGHAQFRLEALDNHLKEKYQLTLTEAREAHPAPPEAVPAVELEKLRRRVEAMGPVNLTAPEEYAQLEERYNFLLTQQQDLVKAKDDLLNTIQKINATTKITLKETFDKVRENFKHIYRQLFPGGEADVRLTDEADVLNAGVEIYAQPPGKKLQNITLLSGGEKALTAVSLLFAFFMVRPAPFAILDEVDAPLDEANVTRFVGLIKAFSETSQFLMITHNKRTMETADTLYGVTMEVQGVSRLLSARLKTAPDRPTLSSPEKALSTAS